MLCGSEQALACGKVVRKMFEIVGLLLLWGVVVIALAVFVVLAMDFGKRNR